jgi:hypothetical protein
MKDLNFFIKSKKTQIVKIKEIKNKIIEINLFSPHKKHPLTKSGVTVRHHNPYSISFIFSSS